MARKDVRYGWLPDRPDHRDYKYTAPLPILVNLPKMWDLSPTFPVAYNQSTLGSCTGNAIGGNVHYCRRKQGLPDFTPSRLFIYYNERQMEGTVNVDAGAFIRDGIKSIVQHGVCPEEENLPGAWPYRIEQFAKKPLKKCYKVALQNQALQYERIPHNLMQMKACIASGFPFVFGFMVFESFESQEVARTGIMPMPAPNESAQGGHAVLAVGYDDERAAVKVRNSWGPEWGDHGYFWMPYEFIANPNFADDFWTIRLMEK